MAHPYSRALIVGAGAGLSASLARLFAKNGLAIALAARDTAKLERLCAETGAVAHACDATKSEEVARLFRILERFDEYLASDQPLGRPVETLFQGPIADALTHTGQLTMLRRLAGAPVRGENYARAAIAAGAVGITQAPPVYEFD